ncbi:hypothetical protein BG005_009992 [Podila minutissima]|nr:hypothetical protein BG005_009992 [Podila minutissima]
MCSKCFKELGKKNGTHQDAKPSSHPEPSTANSHNHHSGGLRNMRRNHHNTTPCPFHHIHATNSDSNSNSNSNAVNGNDNDSDNDSDNDNDFGTCPTNDHPSIIVQSLHSCGQPPKHTGLDEYIFCDSHKAASKHDCDFDFAKMGKDLLTKNNPRLNEKPRGGRSFTRIQE